MTARPPRSTAADLLNGRVVPFFDEHDVKLCRMLTDRGTESAAPPRRTNTSSTGRGGHRPQPAPRREAPQTKRPSASASTKTVLQEFYQVAFRKRIYTSNRAVAG